MSYFSEKAYGVQALACGFKLWPDQENKLKLELHTLFHCFEGVAIPHIKLLGE